jgi:ParB-like chromosome segregation protein Spo0J
MEYSQKAVKDLIPYINNARTHSDEQVTQIASSIREFGFINPIIIDDKNNVIAGHGRLLASKKLGLKEVPTVLVDHLTDTQRKAYVLADNQLALNAGWDDELLKLELAQLDDVGFDLELLGFDLDNLGDLFDSPNDSENELKDTEIDVDAFDFEHECPKCGFQFNGK